MKNLSYIQEYGKEHPVRHRREPKEIYEFVMAFLSPPQLSKSNVKCACAASSVNAERELCMGSEYNETEMHCKHTISAMSAALVYATLFYVYTLYAIICSRLALCTIGRSTTATC